MKKYSKKVVLFFMVLAISSVFLSSVIFASNQGQKIKKNNYNNSMTSTNKKLALKTSEERHRWYGGNIKLVDKTNKIYFKVDTYYTQIRRKGSNGYFIVEKYVHTYKDPLYKEFLKTEYTKYETETIY